MVAYFAISVACDGLPVLLPWSVDTVFILSLLMAFGHWLRGFVDARGEAIARRMTLPRLFLTLLCGAVLYALLVRADMGINTSVRLYGRLGPLAIPAYMLIGMLGTVLFMAGFYVIGMVKPGAVLCEIFALIGRRTIPFLAAHILVYDALEILLLRFMPEISYAWSLVEVAAAVAAGFLLNALIKRLSRRFPFMRLLA